MKDKLEIKAAIQIQKPVHEVFEAIVNPEKMKNYFIESGSGRMETGKKLTWKFPEFKDEVPVRCGDIRPDNYISFYWSGETGKELLVEMNLTEVGNDTLVRVTEKEMENDEAGIKWLGQNTEGWANYLACMKAYLEYGINLRKGAFEFMRNN